MRNRVRRRSRGNELLPKTASPKLACIPFRDRLGRPGRVGRPNGRTHGWCARSLLVAAAVVVPVNFARLAALTFGPIISSAAPELHRKWFPESNSATSSRGTRTRVGIGGAGGSGPRRDRGRVEATTNLATKSGPLSAPNRFERCLVVIETHRKKSPVFRNSATTHHVQHSTEQSVLPRRPPRHDIPGPLVSNTARSYVRFLRPVSSRPDKKVRTEKECPGCGSNDVEWDGRLRFGRANWDGMNEPRTSRRFATRRRSLRTDSGTPTKTREGSRLGVLPFAARLLLRGEHTRGKS